MKKRSSILAHLVILSIILAVAHVIALKFSIYWTTEGVDSVMHATGGFIGALFVIYVLNLIGIFGKTLPRKILLFLFVCVSVLAVGAIWELWEIFVGFTDPFTDVKDTITDLVMDTIGAVLGFFYYDKKLRAKSE